ncbi:MAG: ABC transporter ATP-binding protein [Dehalococcoidia bacterium]|nr:ABC transporter ATP-binding protein [Dehalococcoidia bacterium]
MDFRVHLRVIDLKKTYEVRVPVQALKGVSFQVERGEFVAIMGPSGAGKSTLLHLLALLDPPTSGKIEIDGSDISTLSYHQKTAFRLRELGYVFQEYALLPELNALENVYLPLMLLGTGRKEYVETATGLLQTVGLGQRLHHLVHELSGGEQQRVAVARSLVNKPKVLFADEPCANLDTENKVIVMSLLRRLCNELNQTIVMVTHEMEEREYADRVVWIKDGIVEREEKTSRRVPS